MAFCLVVEAHSFKWNNAGKVNATGVHVRAPQIDRKFSTFGPSAIVVTTVMMTRTVRLTFFKVYRFLDFGIPL